MCTTTITITISATKAVPYPPTISDGTNTVSTEPSDEGLVTAVSTGNQIKFVKAGDITSIEIIETGGQDVFSTNPTAQNNWTGVIGVFPATTTEAYSITYVVDGTTYVLDPQLRMK